MYIYTYIHTYTYIYRDIDRYIYVYTCKCLSFLSQVLLDRALALREAGHDAAIVLAFEKQASDRNLAILTHGRRASKGCEEKYTAVDTTGLGKLPGTIL